MLCRPSSKSHPHLFHRNCFIKDKEKQCPHCKCAEKPIAVQLKLQMSRIPINLLQSVSKMSFPTSSSKVRGGKKSDLIVKSEEEEERRDAVSYKMPGGKIISADR